MSLNTVTFNQNYTHLAVGTSNGFRVYYTEPFSKCHETYEGNISLMEMLFSTSLIALVLSPRRLVIINTKRSSTICELTFPTTILSVKLNRKRLVVVLEDQIYLYDISNMKLFHTVDTAPNPQGVSALSPSSDRCYLAYPLPQKPTPSSTFTPPSHVPPTSPHLNQTTSGHVFILDILTKQSINVIEAHRAPLSCLVFNQDGSRLATASDKGTIIRVFSIPDGKKIFQFRRGSMPSRIYSMSFNSASTMLCVSSVSETIHIFRLLSKPTVSTATAATSASYTSTDDRTAPLRRNLSSRSISPNSVDARSDADSVSPSSSTADLDLSNAMAERKHNGTLAGMIRRTSQNVTKSLATTVGGYLPTSVTDMLEPARDFAWFKIPNRRAGGNSGGGGLGGGNLRSVVAMSSKSPQVMVATSEGEFMVFDIDMDKGGEAICSKTESLLQSSGRPMRAPLDS